MKNATQYEKIIKKQLLTGLNKTADAAVPREGVIPVMLAGILEEDVPEAEPETALAGFDDEFIDLNELRVAPIKEIAEAIGKDYPQRKAKAVIIGAALNALYLRQGRLGCSYMEEMSKRDLRRHLREIGLSPYAAAYTVLMGFGGHAVAVDESLVECLHMDEMIHPESDLEDVQGFLERIIPQKHARAAHTVLREYVASNARRLEQKHAKEAAEREKAEAERKAAEEAAKKAEEEEKARKAAEAEEAEKQKKAKKKKHKKAGTGKKTAKKTGGASAKKGSGKKTSGKKRSAGKSPGKSAKKTSSGKSGKKSSGTSAKKSAKKSARKSSKKLTGKKKSPRKKKSSRSK